MSRATQDTTTLGAASRTQAVMLYGRPFQDVPLATRLATTWSYYPRAPERARFGLLPGRSPLLGESLLFFLFLRVLRCFSSPRWPHDFLMMAASGPPGCPIRRSADQRPFAPPRGFSQLTTSFIASVSLGIHHAPLLSFFSLRGGSAQKKGRATPRCLACANMSKILRRKNRHVENIGFEPMASCMPCKRSSQPELIPLVGTSSPRQT